MPEPPADGVELRQHRRIARVRRGDDRIVEIGVDRRGRAFARQRLRQLDDQPPRGFRIGAQRGEDRRRVHRLALAPAIIIGDHADRGVGQLRLAGQLCLRHAGHADHVAARRAPGSALGAGRELRAVDRDIAAAASHWRARRLGRVGGERREARADRIGHRDMGDDAGAEEARRAAMGAVEILVDDDEPPRRQLLAQRADRRDRRPDRCSRRASARRHWRDSRSRRAAGDGRGHGAAGRRTSRPRSGRSAIRPPADPTACRPRSIAGLPARPARKVRSRR